MLHDIKTVELFKNEMHSKNYLKHIEISKIVLKDKKNSMYSSATYSESSLGVSMTLQRYYLVPNPI